MKLCSTSCYPVDGRWGISKNEYLIIQFLNFSHFSRPDFLGSRPLVHPAGNMSGIYTNFSLLWLSNKLCQLWNIIRKMSTSFIVVGDIVLSCWSWSTFMLCVARRLLLIHHQKILMILMTKAYLTWIATATQNLRTPQKKRQMMNLVMNYTVYV